MFIFREVLSINLTAGFDTADLHRLLIFIIATYKKATVTTCP